MRTTSCTHDLSYLMTCSLTQLHNLEVLQVQGDFSLWYLLGFKLQVPVGGSPVMGSRGQVDVRHVVCPSKMHFKGSCFSPGHPSLDGLYLDVGKRWRCCGMVLAMMLDDA